MWRYIGANIHICGEIFIFVVKFDNFVPVYIPFSDTAWFRLGNSLLFLFTAGFIAISILFLIVSKVIMYKTRNLFDMTYLHYILWCVGEVVVICLFYTFVTVDVVRPESASVIRVFLKAFLYGSIALLVPYGLSAMYFMIGERDRTIRFMDCKDIQSGTPDAAGQDTVQPGKEESRISFFDNSGSLKLCVRSSDLYYIESDDNYIKVWYDDSGKSLRMYMLRCRLRTIEESFRGTSLVRCNRKYIVNLDRVKSLRKEADGYFLEMDNSGIAPIAVTKTYAEDILSRFSGTGSRQES